MPARQDRPPPFRAPRLLSTLLEPTATVKDPQARRRARLLASILIPFAPMLFGITQWTWIDDRLAAYFALGSALCVFGYIVNRKGHSTLAASLLVGWMFFEPYVGVYLQAKTGMPGVDAFLMFTALSIMLAYLLFPATVVIIVALLNILGLSLTPLVLPEVSLEWALFLLLFILAVTGMMVTAAILRQLDQRQLAEQSRALSESEARYRRLFEAAFEALIVHDQGIILDANAVVEQMLGYRLAETTGRPITAFVLPEEWDRVEAQLRLPRPEPFEATFLRRSGKPIQIEALTKEYVFEGRNVSVIALRDLTERKQAEAERLDLGLEREKRKVLVRFMNNLSHDLRTPLTVIKTSLYLLKRLMRDPAQRDHQIQVMESQLQHLQRLMDDLLNMSNLDRGDADRFEFRRIAPNGMIMALIEEHLALARRKHHQIILEASDPLPELLIDKDQVRQMLKHILLNAINYTPDGGTITISTGIEGEHAVIRVQDSGIGIAADDLPYIFDYFFRAESARRTDRGGTGLGLTIARKIAEAHDGSIQVTSALGKGSTFTVRLPLNGTLGASGEDGERAHLQDSER